MQQQKLCWLLPHHVKWDRMRFFPASELQRRLYPWPGGWPFHCTFSEPAPYWPDKSEPHTSEQNRLSQHVSEKILTHGALDVTTIPLGICFRILFCHHRQEHGNSWSFPSETLEGSSFQQQRRPFLQGNLLPAVEIVKKKNWISHGQNKFISTLATKTKSEFHLKWITIF